MRRRWNNGYRNTKRDLSARLGARRKATDAARVVLAYNGVWYGRKINERGESLTGYWYGERYLGIDRDAAYVRTAEIQASDS